MICRHQILLKSGLIVPCGKCPTCLANQRQEWVFRLKQEYLSSVFSIFVTITYNDENLPKDLSVNKKDIQDFHKRLRKHFPPGDLRFYVVSEYGDHTFRPHYHGLYFFKTRYDLQSVYDIFEKAWKRGFLRFGQVEEGSIVYCTKYCLKHSSTPPGRKETFRLMSKMCGGVGYGYLESDISQWHIDNEQFSFVSSDGKRCRMPKYYRDKLSLYRKVTETEEEKNSRIFEAQRRLSDDFEQRFKDFLFGKHFNSFDEAKQAFMKHIQVVYANQDELVMKHCKKQTKM